MNNFEHNQIVAVEELSEITIELALLQDHLYSSKNILKNSNQIFDPKLLNDEVCDFIGAMELIHEQIAPAVAERISLFLGANFIENGFVCHFDVDDSAKDYSLMSEEQRLNLSISLIRDAIINVARLQQRFSKSMRFGILDGYSKDDGTNAKHIRELSISLINNLNQLVQAIPAIPTIKKISLNLFDQEKSQLKKEKVTKWKLQAEKNGTLISVDNYCTSLGRDLSNDL